MITRGEATAAFGSPTSAPRAIRELFARSCHYRAPGRQLDVQTLSTAGYASLAAARQALEHPTRDKTPISGSG